MSNTSARPEHASASVERLITEHIDLWTSAIKNRSTAGRGSSKKIELYGIKQLRELILELAVRGLLVPQDPTDESASELLKRIAAEKARLIKEGTIKKEKPLSPVAEVEAPFSLPKGWLWERFGNLAEHNAGRTLDQGRNQGELRDYITTSNLYWGRFDLTAVKQMPIQDGDLEKCFAIRNDLLICEGGEAGRAAVWDYDYPICFQNHIHRARFWQGINPYYVYRLLEKMSYSGEINNYRKGVGISNMSGKALGSIPLPLPPLAEQHRIVAKVDELMVLCDQLEQQTEASLTAHQTLVETLLNALTTTGNSNTEKAASQQRFQQAWQRIADHFDILFTTEQSIDQLKQTVLQLAVMGNLVPQDSKDEPASELLKKIATEKARLVKEGKIKKEKPLSPITEEEKPFALPDGWVWVRLNELTKLITKGSSPKWQGVSYTEDSNDILFVTSENVGSYKLLLNSPKYVEKKFNEIEPRSILEAGDFLMNIVGASIGRTAIFDIERLANINQAVCLIRLLPLHLHSMFLLHFFNSKTCLEYMYDKQVDNARPNLSMGNIAKFLIPIPPLPEQHRIVAKVDELMTMCDQLRARLNHAQTTQLRLADTITERTLAS